MLRAARLRLARRVHRRRGPGGDPPPPAAGAAARAGASARCCRRSAGSPGMNQVFRSYIGMGYAGCFTPQVVQRNVLENPGWYTAYTPYQAEIAQGRLEALLNFQTMVSDLTGLPIANASLLDEATAAAEAMSLTLAVSAGKEHAGLPGGRVLSSRRPSRWCGPGRRRAGSGSWSAEPETFAFETGRDRRAGAVPGHRRRGARLPHALRARPRRRRAGHRGDRPAGLTLLTPPGEWGADIAVGNTQRFGVPMGYGGPHAAFFATRDAYKRFMPGRIIGVSRDRDGRPALRMALQTREQHIRRDKATSNVCTAQVLLAVMASMYAVYHGPGGLRADRRAGAHPHGAAGQRAPPAALPGRARRLLRHALRRGAGVGPAPAAGRGAGPEDQPPPAAARPGSASRWTRRSRWATWPTSSRCSRSTRRCRSCWRTSGSSRSAPSRRRWSGRPPT